MNIGKKDWKQWEAISVCDVYLVLIKVCNDDAYKKSEPNHATQKYENVYVDPMDLQAQRYYRNITDVLESKG